MKLGIRKIDKGLKAIVKKAVESGRWVEKTGRKHLKLVMKDNESFWVTVAGSTRDPLRAQKNLTADLRRREKDAGFPDFSV